MSLQKAQEIIFQEPYSPSSALYCVGSIMYFLYTGNEYFFTEELSFPEETVINESAKDLIYNLLDTKENRMSFEEFFNHRYFNPDFSKYESRIAFLESVLRTKDLHIATLKKTMEQLMDELDQIKKHIVLDQQH